ncbi:sensor histidine kinase [Abyssisolibacter fermentans]|uniref:sensor histidine kinase n=1 Tax=Abyssisolibacter fermentans TaxID=1766203 RepID=UPI000829F1A1|nr:HAMP domain-containing sensor histidine kinase [Abyssisolibacter fermentans]
MSIKFRLMFSYIGMIVIPIVLIIVLNFMFGFFYFGEPKSFKNLPGPGKVLNETLYKSSNLNRKINMILLDDKEKLKDAIYIKTLGDEFKEVYAGVVLRKGSEILYASEMLDNEFDLDTLPKFKEEFHESNFYNKRSRFVMNSQNDFYFEDGAEASIFVVTDTELAQQDINQSRNIATLIIISVLILTTLALTYSIYKDIIKGIRELTNAATEIKNGNLDYEVKKYSKDEIGELSLTFEKMRLKLKESLEIQKKYEENRKNLISNISHDLKTPIMSIKGHIEGIKDGIAHSPERMDKYIDTIYEKSKDMELLINELFLYSRLDLEKEEFNFQIIDIIEFLRFSVEDLSFDLEKIGGKIRLKYDYEPIFVNIDLQKLKRIILNIVGNSIKYRGEGPLILDINVKKIDEEIVVEIKDNGKGISQENLSLIFDRFYRADKSRNTSVVGSGLGLAISKQIVEKHGGKIWAESKENIGTSIFFSLKEC